MNKLEALILLGSLTVLALCLIDLRRENDLLRRQNESLKQEAAEAAREWFASLEEGE